MAKSLLQVSTTDTLRASQRAQGEALAARLRAGFSWPEGISRLSIHFRERLPWLEDCLIYRPAQQQLTIYWGLSSSDDLEEAVSDIGPLLPRLGVSTGNPGPLLSGGHRHRASALLNPRRVVVYWTSEYEGDGFWRCRLKGLPALYPAIRLAPVVQALNGQPPLAYPKPLTGVEVTYQLYPQHSRPADGLFHYDADSERLLVEVPLSVADFARMKGVVGVWLEGSLRAFWGLGG